MNHQNFVTAEEVSARQNNIKTLIRFGGSLSMLRKLMIPTALVMFFAAATWEVCGLGTAGRMLHPAEASAPMAHSILITQSSKLMVEFVFAWLLLGASFFWQRAAPS